MRIAADHKDRANTRVLAEPSRERIDFCQSAESVWQHVFRSYLWSFKENEVVALRRRHFLRQFQEIQWNWQGHLRETTDFETAHAEQDLRRESLMEKVQRVFFAIDPSGKDENEVGAARGIGGREPGV